MRFHPQFFYKIFFSFIVCLSLSASNYDLTVVGYINQADGIGRQSIGLIECLKDDFNINFIETLPSNLDDVNDDVKQIVTQKFIHAAPVSILEDVLWVPVRKTYEKIPDSKIKIAYSLWESTFIPEEWVRILNAHFDAVVVADPFLTEVYRDSGVLIPIFEIPLGIDIKTYLEAPLKTSPNKPFVFGSSVSFEKRKNQAVLIQAFAEEFGNDPSVILQLNGRYGEFDNLLQQVKSLRVSNIYLTNKVLSKKRYDLFIRSFDCFVNLSKGEGFSICPRESLALGIPCIITNNTAQKSICETGYVYSVPSHIPEWPDYQRGGLSFNKKSIYYGCSVNDVRVALREVYKNYQLYLEKAHLGREWVKQFLWENLRSKYKNLVKPQKVILGHMNVVTDTYLMTNSESLYKKYSKIKAK